MAKRRRKTVLAIGDAHFPWASQKTLRAIYAAIRRIEPDVVIQMGDLYDFFSWSRFPRTHNVYTPAQELKIGRRDAEKFWAAIEDAAPSARRIQLRGNHDDRPAKRALENAPELESFVKAGVASLLKFDGVETLDDSRETVEIDGIGYHHGFRTALGAHARFNLTSMVTAHTHRGYMLPIRLEHETIFELNCGFVADRHAVPMSYGEQRRFSTCTLGYGLIAPDLVTFVPLETEEAR